MPLPLIAAAAPGIIKAAGSLIGSKARKEEQETAKAELAQRRQAYETFEFKDPSAQMTNPFEDLTVNQQQAQFQSQQQQQGLASTLSGLQGAAGGSGIAALAQAMAGQQSQNLQAASASIGQQESANQMAAAQGAQNLQAQRAAGQQYVQEQEFGRTETLLGMSQQRKAAADAARAAATQDLVGGIAEAAGGVAGAMGGGSGGAATSKLASGKLASKKLIKNNPSRFIKNKSGQFQDVNAALGGGASMPDVQIKKLG